MSLTEPRKGTKDKRPRFVRLETHEALPGIKEAEKLPLAVANESSADNLPRPTSPGTLSNFSVSSEGQIRYGRSSYLSGGGSRPLSRSPGRPQTTVGRRHPFWIKNKGVGLVLFAQVFNSLMNVATRLLEIEGNYGEGFHPLQILFVRMAITVTLASTYMWWRKTPDFPFGAKGVRHLLLARGVSGFFGVFGMYYSLLYLPIAEATVLTFLAPILSCWMCSWILSEPFTRLEQIATAISLAGVVLIAKPVSLFSYFSQPADSASGDIDFVPSGNHTTLNSDPKSYDSVTPKEQVMAVSFAMLGVLGGAVVLTSLRCIGKRASTLLTVYWFATFVTVFSAVAMAAIPSIGYKFPANSKDWGYLFALGACGFTSQCLFAAGLQYSKSSRATNMIYTQMLFALGLDKLVFGHSPGLLSLFGSSLILGSAICVALMKETAKDKPAEVAAITNDEEAGLIAGIDMEDEINEMAELRENPMVEVVPLRSLDK